MLELGHCFVATNYLSYVCAWKALVRILRRQNGWAKTARSAETGAPDRDRSDGTDRAAGEQLPAEALPV